MAKKKKSAKKAKKSGKKKAKKKKAKKAGKKKAKRKSVKKAKRKKGRRTTMRSSTGKKLYAVRDAEGRFKDIQTYARAHAADIRKKAADEA